MIKIFTKNKNNKIEFTEQELKTLLDEIYRDGYNKGQSRNYIYTTPSWSPYYSPFYSDYITVTCDGVNSSFTTKLDNKTDNTYYTWSPESQDWVNNTTKAEGEKE